MEKKTETLCLEILSRLDDSGVLPHVILIGSWCIYFYRYYFASTAYSTYIRTRDVDFLVPLPATFTKDVNIFEAVKDLGFLEKYRGSQGYLKLDHPDLSIEFLVPERGRGNGKPYLLPQLSINAQPLRFLDFLIQHVITIRVGRLRLRVPHPAAYALHKCIVFKRRVKAEKYERDIEGALRVFHELIHEEKQDEIKAIFRKMHKKWQETVLRNLKSIEEFEIAAMLSNVKGEPL